MDVIESLQDADPWPNPSHELFMKRLNEDGKSGHSITLQVLRDDKPVTLSDVKPNARLGDGRVGLGVRPIIDETHTVIADVVPGSAAEAAHIKSGDTIASIDGNPVATWYDIQKVLADAKIDPNSKLATVKITYTRPQTDKPLETEMKLGEDALEDIRGVRYQTYVGLTELIVKRKTSNPLVAASWGITETRDFIIQFYLTLRRFADRSISPSNMMGPLGIFAGGKVFAYKGIDWLLWFLSMISANLAVVNFLPIPVVDGGQFMFLILEKIKGKPLSPKAMAIAQYAGLAFLAAVVLFVTYHDILRMVG
jgi:regulator of sigma E protease